MQHVVWDWNGTLLDDQAVVIEACNAVLEDAGCPPVDRVTYQALYTRPLRLFYERLLGRAIAPDEWQRIDDVYHAGYRAGLVAAALAVDAEHALDTVDGSGATQSLLSMHRHHDLLPLVTSFGIDGRFNRIDGLRGPGGGRKAPYLEEHLRALAALCAPTDIVVVGDALDDAVAAAHVGARCVLYDGGSHPRADLERSGVPVAASLLDALQLAGLGCGGSVVRADSTLT